MSPVLLVLGIAAIAAALLVGSAYMRPTSLPLVLILPLIDVVRHRRPMRGLLEAGVALAVAAALLAPWAARNQAQLGAPVLISTNFGPNLWMGNNPASTGAYMSLPEEDFGGEVRRDAVLKERAVKFIADDPTRYLQLSARRALHSFKAETIGVIWNEKALADALETPLKLISSAYWLLAFGIGFAGAVLFLIQRPVWILDPLVVCPALFAAVAVLTVGQDRYHMPMIPFVAIFAASVIDRLRNRERPAPAVATEAVAR